MNLKYWLIATSILAIVFILFPNIDIYISSLFFNGNKFFLSNNIFLFIINKSVNILITLTIILLIPLLIYQIFIKEIEFINRKKIIFLMCVLLLGPGLLTNTILKNNSGRARPAQLQMFNSKEQKHFTRAFLTSNQCKTNCSFVSGHVSAATFFLAFAFLYRKKWIWTVSILYVILVSFDRIAEGRHFLSDCIFAFLFTLIIIIFLYNIFFNRHKETKNSKRDLLNSNSPT